MQSRLLAYMRGYVLVEIAGNGLEAFCNAAVEAGCAIWNVSRISPQRIRLYADLRSFFAFRALLKQTGCRSKVLRRYGLPFVLRRLEMRLFFVGGFAVFIAGLYVFSQMVWQVQIEGNERISYDQVVKAAEQQGIRRMQWKFKLEEPSLLSQRLTQALPGAAWVGVDISGTQVRIQVVEQAVPEQRELMSPRHLIATADAVVTGIYVERGRALAKTNMRVKQGDILISGLIGSNEHGRTVVAQGSVRGLVWHEYAVSSPLVHHHKVYTGDRKVRRYVVLGGRALQITGYGKLPFAAYDTRAERTAPEWRGFKLPVGLIREELKGVDTVEVPLAADEAKSVGLMHARTDVLLKAGEGSRITAEKILHEKIEGGKVYMKVLFEVEQEITKELPIIRGE